MKKAPDAFRTISEVADLLETPAHVLRFWESKFYQIRPVKRAGGRRYYRPDDVALVNGIRVLLQDKTMNIRRIQRMLQEQGVKHVAALGGPVEALTERAAALGLAQHGQIDDEEALIDDEVLDAEIVDDPSFDDRRNDPEPVDLSQLALVVEAGALRDLVPPPVPPPVPVSPMPAPQMSAATPPTPAGSKPTDPPTDEAPRPDPPILEPQARTAQPEATATPAAKPQPVAPPPITRDPLPTTSDRSSLARQLRLSPRGQLGARRDRLDLVARRIDALLERMSEASGAGRW